MTRINPKYIDQHWLVFIAQGILALLFGWMALFTRATVFSFLIALVSIFLLSLGIIDLLNAINRHIKNRGWLPSVIIAIIEAAVATALLFVSTKEVTWAFIIIAVFTIIKGLSEIILGLTNLDPVDRFIRITCGICGVVVGFVIFNTGHLAFGSFIRLFGAYMLILGISHLIYGVHNYSQKVDYHLAKSKAASKRAKKAARTKKATQRKTK